MKLCPRHGKIDPCPGGVGIEAPAAGRKLYCDTGIDHCPKCGDTLIDAVQGKLF